MTAPYLADRDAVARWLPHRGNFLLPDRVLEVSERSITGEMDVTDEASWAPDHFPGHPILPGVLQIELAAQLAAILLMHSMTPAADALGALASVRQVSFRSPVRPPATLRGDVVADGGTGRGHTYRFRLTSARRAVADGRLSIGLTTSPTATLLEA